MRLKKSVISLLVLAAIVLSPFISLRFDSQDPMPSIGLQVPVEAAIFNEFALPLDQRFGFIGTDHRADANLLDRFYYYYDPNFNGTYPQQLVRMVDHYNGKNPDEDDYTVISTTAQVPDYSYWLVGNEPNAQTAPIDYQATYTQYATLTHDWYVKLKGLNSSAQVFVGQTAYFDQAYLDGWWSRYSQMYGTPPFDGYTVHAYTAGNEYDVQAVPNNVKTMREWMNSHGLSSKPLWLTEYGELDGHAGTTHPASIEWDDPSTPQVDSLREYMRTVNSWLVSHTDLVQRWFWFADVSTYSYQENGQTKWVCLTGNLYHKLDNSTEAPACWTNTQQTGLSDLGNEYINYSEAVGGAIARGYLPIVVKNNPGWNTGARVRNNDTVARYVTLIYYDTNGKGISGDIAYIPPGGYADISQYDNPYPVHTGTQFTSFTGSAKILSQGPVAAEVNEWRTTGGDSMAYTGISSGSTTVYAEAIMYNQGGRWTSSIAIMNATTTNSNASVTIRYYNDISSTPVATETKTLAPNAYWGVFNGSSGLPSGFVGTAKITSTQPIAVVVNLVDYVALPGTGGAQANEGAAGANTVYLPITEKNYGGWNSMIYVRNDDTATRTLTVRYYDTNGMQVALDQHQVNAEGYFGFYQQNTPGLPDGSYAAVVSSPGPVTAVVNEWNYQDLRMAYTGLPAGGTTVFNVPLMYNYGGWTTGIAVINAGSVAATVTSSYYDKYGASVGNPDVRSNLASKGQWVFSNGNGHVPSGFIGTGKVTSLQPMGVVVHNSDSSGTAALAYSGWQ